MVCGSSSLLKRSLLKLCNHWCSIMAGTKLWSDFSGVEAAQNFVLKAKEGGGREGSYYEQPTTLPLSLFREKLNFDDLDALLHSRGCESFSRNVLREFFDAFKGSMELFKITQWIIFYYIFLLTLNSISFTSNSFVFRISFLFISFYTLPINSILFLKLFSQNLISLFISFYIRILFSAS